MKQRQTWIGLMIVVVALVGFYYFTMPAKQESLPNTQISGEADHELLAKFEKAMSFIEEQYVDEVTQDELLEGAIEGMLQKLDDPYSVYMDKDTAQQFVESLGSHFEGIGAEVSMQDGRVTIIAPIRNSPAEDAGLRANDQIIQIDGEDIEGLSLYDAVLKIRGEKGTEVVLTIARPTVNEPFDISVKRDEIPIETVHGELIEQGNTKVGVMDITSFSEQTANEFATILAELEGKGMEALVIDVRGNPGGYLDAVRDIGKLIIPNEQPIVQIENREGEKVRYPSTLKSPKPYPIVGITDGASASASEILAGALIEAGKYDVIGETTFGKGTVQQTIDLGDGSELKLSMFRWLTSNGNDINGKGVEPTIEVKQPEYFYVAPLTIETPLEFEMFNEQIKSAQTMLKGLGFETGRTDGFFDRVTKDAVIAFQQAQNLEPTGKIDEETGMKLQDQIVEKIRDVQNDVQRNTAIELAAEQAKK